MRVTLHEVEERDLEAVAAWATDPLVTAFLTWDAGNREDARRWIQSARSEAQRVPRRVWELTACDGDQVIGSGRLSVRDPANRSGDIGYVVRRDRWGHGFGTAIAEELVAFGFRRLQLHRLWATCIADNVASARVLEKAGMRLEGRLRDHALLRGQWRDSLLYAIIQDQQAPWRR
ncbi:MAG: GNAT family N-acetyltransferase [Candidatus Dormibacteraeota bacterium]|nr:GNAT family N-acetyltransferase [Candidatus Dormibacteraeota bacterium]